MLSQAYSLDKLKSTLIPQAQWYPYPTASEREAWQALPQGVRAAHIAMGEGALDFIWPPLPATRFLDFARDGNRRRFERLHFDRRRKLASLVIAECMEGQGRFVDDIVNGVWAICEESYWGVPAHIGVQKAGRGLPDTAEPTVDLFAAETSALLAWTLYLVGPQLDAVSPLIRPRIEREIDYKILTPLLERDDFGWMGFINLERRVNNWNPWINSNWLATALIVEKDPERRAASVAKAMRSLDRFIDPYPRDGGCDEGPSYWGRAGASMFDCLELLYSATGGEIDVYGQDLVRNMGQFIYRVQIAGNYFINFADAPALVMPDPALVFRFGQRIEDEAMAKMGAWLAQDQALLDRGITQGRSDVPTSLGRLFPALFILPDLTASMAANPTPPLSRDVFLDEIEVMVARDRAGSTAGLYLGAKGGHNQESHNHNDIGNFVVYIEGKPVFVDAGVETYTAKTFSAQRYEIWTMQSAYHSLLPTIDGVMQAPGPEFAAQDVAYEVKDDKAQFRLDIAGAYPPEAKLKAWQRTITQERGQAITIQDHYELSEAVQTISLSLLTPARVETNQANQAGLIRCLEAVIVDTDDDKRVSGTAQIEYDPEQFTVSTEVIPIEDERLGGTWGKQLSRIVFRTTNPSQQGEWQFVVKPL